MSCDKHTDSQSTRRATDSSDDESAVVIVESSDEDDNDHDDSSSNSFSKTKRCVARTSLLRWMMHRARFNLCLLFFLLCLFVDLHLIHAELISEVNF